MKLLDYVILLIIGYLCYISIKYIVSKKKGCTGCIKCDYLNTRKFLKDKGY